MNYINNVSSGMCLGFAQSEKIEIGEMDGLVDCETGKLFNCLSGGFTLGKTYRCEKQWILRRGFEALGTYKTEEEARKAYDKIVSELAVDNKVIDI